MGDGKGYLLPEEVQPEGYQCLILYIPDDPTGYYLRAMSGAFSDMARWVNWEKDGTNRASLAASAWKDAVDFTYENGWTNCMNIQDQLDNIFDQLKELNDMNINVGCGCGCHQNLSEICNEWLNLSEEEGFEPFPPEPGDIEEGAVLKTGQELCDWANAYAGELVVIMAKLKSFFGGLAVTTASIDAWIAGMLAKLGIKLVLSPALMIFFLQSVLAVVFSANLTDNASDAAQIYQQKFVCALAFATSPADAKNRYMSVVSQIRADFGVTVASLFWFLGMMTNWAKFMESGSAPLPAEYAGSTCDCAGETPTGPGGWYAEFTTGIPGSTTWVETTNTDPSYVAGGTVHRDTEFGAYSVKVKRDDIQPAGFTEMSFTIQLTIAGNQLGQTRVVVTGSDGNVFGDIDLTDGAAKTVYVGTSPAGQDLVIDPTGIGSLAGVNLEARLFSAIYAQPPIEASVSITSFTSA